MSKSKTIYCQVVLNTHNCEIYLDNRSFKGLKSLNGTYILCHNCGLDAVYGVYRAVKVFNLSGQINIITDTKHDAIHQYLDCNLYTLADLRVITGSVYIRLNLITGLESLDDSTCDSLRGFRDYIYSFYNIRPCSVDIYRVLILKGQTQRHASTWVNIAECMDYINRHANISVSSVNWPELSAVERVKIMSETDIVVSLPSSDITDCLLLPDGATVICPQSMGRQSPSGKVAVEGRNKNIGLVKTVCNCIIIGRESCYHYNRDQHYYEIVVAPRELLRALNIALEI